VAAGTTRDPWFDNAKMALVILVVVGHAWTLLPHNAVNDHLYDFLYAWHVPAFVLVTGYLSRSFAWTGRRLWQLVRTILVPYLLFEGLLALFRPGSSAVLVAQGDLASSSLVDGLRDLGHDVTAVEAYSTVARRPSEPEVATLGAADVVVLGSGSAARALAPIGSVARLVAIGPSTARVAGDAGLVIAAVSASPASDDLVAAIAAALAATDGT